MSKVWDKQIGGQHYQKFKIQPSKFVVENKLLFPEGCAIKYICRHPFKGGKEDFVGVIKSDYKNFYWADSSNDDGKVIGTILKKNKIETCYLDSGRDAIAGCSILERMK